MFIKRFCGLLVLLLGVSAFAQSNLVTNPGFEDGDKGWGWITSAAASYSIDSSVHFSGGKSYRISDGSKFQPEVYCKMGQTVGGLKGNTAYRLGVWVKAKDADHAWTGGGPGWGFHVPFPNGTYDWQHVEADYVTHPGETTLDILVIVEGKTDSLWLDDFSLTEDAERTQQMRAEAAKAKKEIQEKVSRLPAEKLAQYQRIEQTLVTKPDLSADPYIKLDMAVAKRFLDRIAGDKKQSADWTVLQAEEIGEVLDGAEKLIQATSAGQRAAIGSLRHPGPDRPVLKDGLFWIKDHDQQRPFFFAGYGHFGGVIKDLPNFPSLGASLIQDARFGPSTMNEDGSLDKDGQSMLADIEKAGQLGMRVDLLLSPHYFPKWAMDKAPDLPNGNPHWLNYQIDHPMARKVLTQYLATIGDKLKDSPGLLSFCLTNEPAYEQGAREAYSRPIYEKFLADHYGTIDKLNEMYGTKYESFQKVEVPGKMFPDGVGQQRAYFDWVTFDQEHWADFHKWMNDILKQHAPNVPTHAKTMVFYAMDRDRLRYGVDPELFCRATDLAGCDPHVFWTPGADQEWAYEWLGQEFWYDLLHSFRGQGVFNSENHIISDNSPAQHIPSDHTYSVLWQGALHHQAATTIWVWDEPTMFPLSGSIYLRPANIAGAGRAMFDLSRFSPEVRTIESAPARFALLYSMPSAIWESPNYKNAMMSTYTALTLMGEPVTFVSERQLAEGTAPHVECILIPQATHVKDFTVAKLADYASHGGKIITVGENCLAYDEYHRQRTLPDALKQTGAMAFVSDDQTLASLLRIELNRMGWTFKDVLTENSATRAWGVEYRAISQSDQTLIPIINMRPEAQTVDLSWLNGSAKDLLTGETHDVKHLSLKPMGPMLLEVPK